MTTGSTLRVLVMGASIAALTGYAQPSAPYDLLIKGGRVLDGTGNPWFPADIAVREGRIVEVGKLASARATTTVDASGKYVAPGFIDIHSHADDGARVEGGLRDRNRERRAAPNLVSQGITTVVVNQDGRSPWPVATQRELMEKHGIGVNAMLMVGHGTVRRLAMGDDPRREATPAEVAKMRELVRQALTEGAVGLSAGLEYEPGRWSTTSISDVTGGESSSDNASALRALTGGAARLGAIAVVAALFVPWLMPHLPPRYLTDGLGRSTGSGPG